MTGVAKVMSVAPIGFEGQLIEVESDMKQGLPTLQVVGLGSKAIDEAKERVRSAITNSLLTFPPKKLVINLAPAELPKDGALFDVPMALAILVVSGQLRQTEVRNAVFAGELALDGSVRPIKGAASIAETARSRGFSTIYLPAANCQQAVLVSGVTVMPLHTLKDLFLHLKGEAAIEPFVSLPPAPATALLRGGPHLMTSAARNRPSARSQLRRPATTISS